MNSPAGVPSIAGLTFVGGGALSGSALELTNGGSDEVGAAWSATPVNVQNFTTDLNFQPRLVRCADQYRFLSRGGARSTLGRLPLRKHISRHVWYGLESI